MRKCAGTTDMCVGVRGETNQWQSRRHPYKMKKTVSGVRLRIKSPKRSDLHFLNLKLIWNEVEVWCL